MAEVNQVINHIFRLKEIDLKNGGYYSLNCMKLQKLLYICQGMSYLCYGVKIMEDVVFEAWLYGPSIPEVHYRYREFHQFDIKNKEKKQKELDEKSKKVIENVWDVLKNRSCFYLTNLCCDMPFYKYRYGGYVFKDHVSILDEDIKKMFAEEKAILS